MIKVLGENYYIDLDKVEEYIDMSIQEEEDETMSGSTEMKINIIKFEMIKMLMDTILTEHELAHQLYGVDNDIEVSIPAPENKTVKKEILFYF